MSNCDIRLQSWGHRVALVCLTCGEEDTAGKLLTRAEDAEGLTTFEVVDLADKHRDYVQRSNTAAKVVGGEQVEGQATFGTETPAVSEPDLVAFGDEPEFGPGYHPRTGQRLEEDTADDLARVVIRHRTDGGPSLREYLESKGEM